MALSNFTDNITFRRKRQNLTNKQLASIITNLSGKYVSEFSVGAWQRGENEPSASQLYYLAKALNCTVHDFYTDKANRTSIDTKRLVDEISALSEHEQNVIDYMFSAWDGDIHALIELNNLYMNLPKSVRRDIAGFSISLYEHSGTSDKVNIEYLNNKWLDII